MTPKRKVTASPRGGVESNRKRTGSPQATNSIRRGVTTSLLIRGEVRNSSDTLEMAGKAMSGHTTWLEAECREVCAR